VRRAALSQVSQVASFGLFQCFLFLIGVAVVLVAGAEVQHAPIALEHVAVIDTANSSVETDMTVVIVGDHIADVGKAEEIKVPSTAQVFDGRGKFLMPGLCDMHIHLFNYVSPRPPNAWYFPLFVANGVTCVRDMWTKVEDMSQVRECRRLQLDGSVIAPNVAAVGTLVDGPAGAETTNPAALTMGPHGE
jgi:hypothetical protein